MNVIKFYKTDSAYGCFSNFSKHTVYYKGPWKTAEHCYQAMKFSGTSIDARTKISKAQSTFEAANLGRKLTPIRTDWDEIRLEIMYEILLAKFVQHSEIRETLFSTKNSSIEEDSPYDSFWGVGADGSGENHLGKLLMKVRGELKEEYKNIFKYKPPWMKYEHYENNDIRWRMGSGETDISEWSLWFHGLSREQKLSYLKNFSNPWSIEV